MRFARLLAEHEATEGKLKKRVTRLERKMAVSAGVVFSTEMGEQEKKEEAKKD